jgi:hypothetical protein
MGNVTLAGVTFFLGIARWKKSGSEQRRRDDLAPFGSSPGTSRSIVLPEQTGRDRKIRGQFLAHMMPHAFFGRSQHGRRMMRGLYLGRPASAARRPTLPEHGLRDIPLEGTRLAASGRPLQCRQGHLLGEEVRSRAHRTFREHSFLDGFDHGTVTVGPEGAIQFDCLICKSLARR